MLTFNLSVDLEKKISFSKGVCSERTLGNEKTSTCPETLVARRRATNSNLSNSYSLRLN